MSFYYYSTGRKKKKKKETIYTMLNLEKLSSFVCLFFFFGRGRGKGKEFWHLCLNGQYDD
jgi:hypothetical protein